jgi:hypothetical protein
MMIDMKNLGPCRKSPELSGLHLPPVLFAAKSGRSGVVSVFEPYEEDLPLQSGYYTFVLDSLGHFRVKWGNTSSHAAFVNGDDIASAGNFRIGRMGKLAEVLCSSYDYRIRYASHRDRAVVYTVESFVRNHAFDVSIHAVFTFRRGLGDTFALNYGGEPITEEERQQKLQLLDAEGCEPVEISEFTSHQLAAFDEYIPPRPPQLYGIQVDYSITALEEDGDICVIPHADPLLRYSVDNSMMPTGKPNFVIDEEGWLVLGMKHHHFLSGGVPIGGAGHLITDEYGHVDEMQVNFSGHYRPPLSAEYVRYVYRTIKGHPLITVNPDCKVKGRKFDEETLDSSLIWFEPADLESDDPMSDEYLERALL